MSLNPQVILNTILNNSQMMQNPVMNNAINLYRNNDTQGLKSLAENICKERGITVDQIRQQIGI